MTMLKEFFQIFMSPNDDNIYILSQEMSMESQVQCVILLQKLSFRLLVQWQYNKLLHIEKIITFSMYMWQVKIIFRLKFF